MDRQGQVYIADDRGNIDLYDQDGQWKLNYSPAQITNVTMLDSWNALRILVFYEDFQEIRILDRFLSPGPVYQLQDMGIGYASLATFTGENHFWILDQQEQGLARIDGRNFNRIGFTSFDLLFDTDILDFTWMQEYQNLLFISEANKGILLFDNFGNYKTTIPAKGVDYFSFFGDQLVTVQSRELVLTNIYDYSIKKIPLERDYDYFLIGPKKAFGITENQLDIFSW